MPKIGNKNNVALIMIALIKSVFLPKLFFNKMNPKENMTDEKRNRKRHHS